MQHEQKRYNDYCNFFSSYEIPVQQARLLALVDIKLPAMHSTLDYCHFAILWSSVIDLTIKSAISNVWFGIIVKACVKKSTWC